jgi:hypothetical protein
VAKRKVLITNRASIDGIAHKLVHEYKELGLKFYSNESVNETILIINRSDELLLRLESHSGNEFGSSITIEEV